jgi:hypothetical protein
MITKSVRALVLAVTMTLPAIALAQGAPPTPPPNDKGGEFAKVHEACRADVERLCKDIKPGDGRIRECMRAHHDELSDGCKAAIKEARQHRHEHR